MTDSNDIMQSVNDKVQDVIEKDNRETDALKADKGKGKAVEVEPLSDEEEEEQDSDDSDDDDLEDEDEDGDEDLVADLDEMMHDIDPKDIVPVSSRRRTRAKEIDYSSAEANERAGLSAPKPEGALSEGNAHDDDDEDDGEFRGDESMDQ